MLITPAASSLASAAGGGALSISLVDGFVLLIMAATVLMFIRQHHGEVAYVTSQIDGRRYLVRALPDRQRAADMIARLNAKLTALVQHMVALQPAGREAAVALLYENYDPAAVSEGGTEIGYTSYSVNKGEKIVMCLRHKDESFVDENVLMYVAVHELGHLMTDEVGHTEAFWDNFRVLITQAVALGLYRKVDFASDPRSYCGISITSSVI